MSHGSAVRRSIAVLALAAVTSLWSCVELPLVELPDEQEVGACSPDDALEDNDVPTDAWFVDIGSHQAILCANDDGVDADFFSFQGKPNRRYQVRIEGVTASAGWTLTAFDATSADKLEIDGDGAFILPDTGHVVLQVDASQDALAAGHDYTLTLLRPNSPPTADFTVQPERPGPGDTIRVTADVSDPDGDDIPIHAWSFGDGATADGTEASHVYDAAGSFDVVLVATDEFGAADTVTKSVVVGSRAASIEVEPPVLALTAIGDSAQLSARALDAAGTELPGVTFTWSTADPTVAAVDTAGIVRATGTGETLILCELEGLADTVPVSVAQLPATVEVQPGEAELAAFGATQAFTAVVRDARGHEITGATLAWSSSDMLVATVDAAGVATSRGNGLAEIIATAGPASGRAALHVEQVIDTVIVMPDSAEMLVGDSIALHARILDANGHDVAWGVTLEWTTADSAVATVDVNGVVRAIGAGTTTLSADAHGTIARVTITVTAPVIPIGVLFAVSGDAQTDTVGKPLAAPLVVRLAWQDSTDGSWVDYVGHTIQWRVVSGGGSIQPDSATTGIDGRASAVWTLGPVAGEQLVRAVRPGIDSVEFSATALPAAPRIASVLVVPSAVSLTAIGDTAHLTATALDAGGVPLPGETFTWITTDPDVAEVDTDGVVWATGAGEAQIIGALEGQADTVSVSVVQLPDSVAVQPEQLILPALGDTATFTAVVFDALGHEITGAAHTWSSSDTMVATVDSVGVVIARSNGVTYLTATAGSASGRAELFVEQAIDSVVVTPDSAELAVGDTLTLHERVLDANGHEIASPPTPEWSTADAAVATVDVNGVVLATGAGTTTVRVSVNGKSAAATITVTPPETLSCASPDGTWISGGIDADATWTPQGSPYVIDGPAYVFNATLTIQPGTLVCGNPDASMSFNGGRLLASGTADEPIVFSATDTTAGWGGLVWWNTGADTSYIRHALIEHAGTAGEATAALYATGVRSAVVVEDTRIRQSHQGAVTFWSAGSRLTRVVVDTTRAAPIAAVVLGDSTTFEASTVRGSDTVGIALAGTEIRLLGGSVENAASIGVLEDTGGYGPAVVAGVPVRVLGSGSVPYQGSVSSFARIWPTAAAQANLTGNARDVAVFPGAEGVEALTATATSAIPWEVHANLSFMESAVLRAEPGARIAMGPGVGIWFTVHDALGGPAGRLHAVGAPDRRLTFTALGDSITERWAGLHFRGAPADTSRLGHVTLEHALVGVDAGFVGVNDVTTGDHPVTLDTVYIRETDGAGVILGAAGSRITGSAVHRAATAGTAGAVHLGASTTLQESRVSSSGGNAVIVGGSGVRVNSCDIYDNAGHAVLVSTGDVAVNECDLLSNAGLGVANNTGVEVNAEYNFWGDPAGPAGPDGDDVSDNVDYDPWLRASRHLPQPATPDPYEPNDDGADAWNIDVPRDASLDAADGLAGMPFATIDDPVRGRAALVGDDVDRFAFALGAATGVEISLANRSTERALVLELSDVASGDVRVPLTVAPGADTTITVNLLGTAESPAGGHYELLVRRDPAQPADTDIPFFLMLGMGGSGAFTDVVNGTTLTEPNDLPVFPGASAPAALPFDVAGGLYPAGDVDLFRIPAPAGTPVEVLLDSRDTGAVLQAAVLYRAASGRLEPVPAATIALTGGDHGTLAATLPADGPAFLALIAGGSYTACVRLAGTACRGSILQATGTQQAGIAGRTLADSIGVFAFAGLIDTPDGPMPDNPAPDVLVHFDAPAGFLSMSDVHTDAFGRAAVQYTLPATPGEYTVRAWTAGSDTVTFTLLALESTSGLDFVQAVAGDEHSCALTSYGAAYCWGENYSGQLGAGLEEWDEIPLPVRVAGGHTFRKLSAGHNGTTCGITTDDRMFCWGYGGSGNLGNGSDIHSFVPVEVADGLRWKDLGVGTWHTCGVTTDNEAYCWGDGSYGALGNGFSGGWSASPTLVAGGHTFASITAGEVFFTCALDTAGKAWCWGSNSGGVVGNGSISGTFTVPTEVVGGHTFTSISAGQDHVCAATGTGAYCWGWGGDGQLGTGDDPPVGRSGSPLLIAGTHAFNDLEAGEYFACARTDAGDAHCWGAGWYGQLGNGSEDSAMAPTPVAGGLKFRSVGSGTEHSCGVATDGAVYCWGSNSSKLGVSSDEYNVLTPMKVGGEP